MNKSIKIMFIMVIGLFSLNTVTYAQKIDTLIKSIEQRKSYIFAQYLEKPYQINVVDPVFQLSQPSVFQKEELPLFCKMEFMIKTQTQIPVKIRLGDIEYVDRLESKSILYK